MRWWRRVRRQAEPSPVMDAAARLRLLAAELQRQSSALLERRNPPPPPQPHGGPG